ncbi:FHA domain-containing protein PS1-like isoform X2 [Abrus precatorius]|uniref:FHA domain-containing protein PS1-like isoform X2 n=1 Tax=Abrus precatorius TaxID=3816 RepID=A0A8B8MKG7_ABRPR|nr:FHA domain-containing protein PS1-like isoform X2 [Abrus precatorius]
MATIAMAEKKKENLQQQQEEQSTIPLLTVLKNNAILKNIFIIFDSEEHAVLIGRHPHCDVVLTHPSVSRFHLKIRSKPSSCTLSLVDLGSVHGTWACGRKLEPGVSVELKEGDTFTVGVSTRVYRLSWVPLAQLDNLEVSVELVSFCCDEERKSYSKDETFGVPNDSFGTEMECFPTMSGGENKLGGFQDRVLFPPYVQSVDEVDHTQKIDACPEVEMPGETNLLCTFSEFLTHNICLPVVEAVQGAKMHCSSSLTNVNPASFDEKGAAVIPKESEFGYTCRDHEKNGDILTIGARIFNSENACLLVGDDIPVAKFHQIKIVEDASVDLSSDGENQDECIKQYKSKLPDQNAKPCHEQWYSLDELIEDKSIENIDSASFDEKGIAAVTVMPTESEFGSTIRDEEKTEDVLTRESRIINSENTSLLDEEAIPVNKFQQIKIVEEAADSIPDGEKEDKCCKELNLKLQASLNAKCCVDLVNSVDEIADDTVNKYENSISSTSFKVESPNCSMPQEAVFNITNKIENQTPQSLIATTRCSEMKILEEHVGPTEKSSTFSNIWAKRGKAVSAPQVRVRKSRYKSISKVDTEVEMSNVNDIINKAMPKDIFCVLSDEEEIFSQNRENSGANTYHLRFMRKKGNLEEIKHSKSQRSLNWKADCSPNIYSAKNINAISNKENQTPKLSREWKPQRKPIECHINSVCKRDIMELKKNRTERVPFQSLTNSGGDRKSMVSKSVVSGPVGAAKTINDASNCGQISRKHTKPSHISGEQKKSWDMVADATSLLNKESRKALQLLQGLSGTRLIIPKLVIRELNSMKQQLRIFRRTSEASLALEFIEECMEKTRRWIHIQSSKECASPTVENHILDCALQYRRKENVGQLVLLSDDVSLKIKSMAKGLLCETVQQFRHSLVNPFSERFMWPNSSPRGPTWSCQDDVVLREKYYGLPSKAGLKLITQPIL